MMGANDEIVPPGTSEVVNPGYGNDVTETSSTTVINEALAVIDSELLRLAARDMVTASDVTNMLLDLRLLLAPAVVPSPEPQPA